MTDILTCMILTVILVFIVTWSLHQNKSKQIRKEVASKNSHHFKYTLQGNQMKERSSSQSTRFLKGYDILMQNLSSFLDDDIFQTLSDLRNRVSVEQRKLHSKTFMVSVVALMKSGKSTFLNSLIQSSILPSEVLPETASIVCIEHDPDALTPSLHMMDEKRTKICAGSDVGPFLKGLNIYFREVGRNPSHTDPRFNEHMKKLLLKTRIVALNNFRSSIRFLLSDTPGYNEAVNNSVTKATKEILAISDIVLYIIDVTKSMSTDEAFFLSQLIESRPELLHKNRSIFILNKIDELGFRKERIKRAKKQQKEYFSKRFPTLRKLVTGNLFPVSTFEYLTATLALNGDEVRSYDIKKLLGIDPDSPQPLYPLSEKDVDYLHERVKKSRFLDLEQHVVNALAYEAPKLFAQIIHENLRRIINEMKSSLSNRITMAKEDISTIANAIEKLSTVQAETGIVLSTLEHYKGQLKRDIKTVVEKNRWELQQSLANFCADQQLRGVYKAAEEASNSCKKYLEGLVLHIQTAYGFAKAQSDLSIREPISQYQTEVEAQIQKLFNDIVLTELEGVLSESVLSELKKTFLKNIVWPRTAICCDWTSNIDISAVATDCIETIRQKAQVSTVVSLTAGGAQLGGLVGSIIPVLGTTGGIAAGALVGCIAGTLVAFNTRKLTHHIDLEKLESIVAAVTTNAVSSFAEFYTKETEKVIKPEDEDLDDRLQSQLRKFVAELQQDYERRKQETDNGALIRKLNSMYATTNVYEARLGSLEESHTNNSSTEEF